MKKICIDCTYHIFDKNNGTHLCSHEESRDIVDGAFAECRWCRYNYIGFCKNEGLMFKPKELK